MGLSDKKYEKIVSQLGAEFANEVEAKSKEELEALVVNAQKSISQATEERDANPKYQEAKANCKALSEGLKDVKKRQNAITALALSVLDSKGQE